MIKDLCTKPGIQLFNPYDLLKKAEFPINAPKMATAHPVEVQLIKRFFRTAVTRVLPSGAVTNTPAIDEELLSSAWYAAASKTDLLPIG